MTPRKELKVISVHRSRPLLLTASQARLTKAVKPTPEHPMIISASELRDFLRCRVKWAWRYHHRIVPRDKPLPLIFGDYGHQILGSWYSLPDKGRTRKAMRQIVKRIIGSTNPNILKLEDAELLRSMTVGYAAWTKMRDYEIGVHDPCSEVYFDEPLTKDGSIRVHGLIDVEFEPRSFKRTIGMFEHKFKKTIQIDHVDLNLQLSVYLWALRRKFPRAKRYIAYFNVLRKQAPGPRVRADLFAREPIERTDDEIHQWEIDTRRICQDMLDASIYANPMDSCSWECDYQTPCLMRGKPDDLEFVLKRDFINKDGTELTLYGD